MSWVAPGCGSTRTPLLSGMAPRARCARPVSRVGLAPDVRPVIFSPGIFLPTIFSQARSLLAQLALGQQSHARHGTHATGVSLSRKNRTP